MAIRNVSNDGRGNTIGAQFKRVAQQIKGAISGKIKSNSYKNNAIQTLKEELSKGREAGESELQELALNEEQILINRKKGIDGKSKNINNSSYDIPKLPEEVSPQDKIAEKELLRAAEEMQRAAGGKQKGLTAFGDRDENYKEQLKKY